MLQTISNDKDFKATLASLSDQARRQATALLIQQVIELCPDQRVQAALQLAGNQQVSETELKQALRQIGAARVESSLRSTTETDWRTQAGHFVIRATQECLKPRVDMEAAWTAAMQARMARLCQMTATSGGDNNEAQAQYLALAEYLQRQINQIDETR